MSEVKFLKINGDGYIFNTLEELVDMLKEDNYECILTIRKKRTFRRGGIKL